MRSLFLSLPLILFLPAVVGAHPGGLDSSGCHHDREHGGYHCHREQSGSADFYTMPSSVKRDRRGRIQRSSSARRRFLKAQGLTRTPAGCQVDHVVPLAKGGADDPANMQLLCGAALEAKERTELK